MLFANRIEEVIKSYQMLIQQKSYSGQEGEVTNATKTMMQRYWFDDIHTGKHGNIVGDIADSRPRKTLVLDGHIDTVPVNEEKWSHNSYGGNTEGGKIYGRSTTDTKDAVTAMIPAVSSFDQDNQRNFAGKIHVACIVHEECFEGVVARLANGCYKPDYVIIGEVPELNLKIGRRGCTGIAAGIFGKPAHSASPQAGINAVYKMTQLINKIRTITSPTHPVLGPGILEPADIKSSSHSKASVVPDYCHTIYDRRLLMGETKENVAAPLENALAGLTAQNPQFKARVSHVVGREPCHTDATIEGKRFFPGWVYDESDEFVQVVLVGIHKAGFNPTTTQYSFCTNGSHYAGEARVKIIGSGPSREGLAHTADEYIEIDQLTGSASGYYSIIQTLYHQQKQK